MSVYLDDGDVTLYHGDAAAVLTQLPEGSVDCCVTSPPYFGLRDYGTATWDGGDPACDHVERMARDDAARVRKVDAASGRRVAAEGYENSSAHPFGYRGTCGKCGAVRHDVQIGLEPTPEEYVAVLVCVFRQVWRVLAPWGTCFVNIGDSYDGAKNLLLIPARLSLALQADGWWVRSLIVWAKPNPMPESCKDRPTSAHEDVYLLTKAPRYYYDAEAVREQGTSFGRQGSLRDDTGEKNGSIDRRWHAAPKDRYDTPGRNLRNVWSIATEPVSEAHFATFPTELVRRCLAAGCPERVCRECGEPSRRIVDVSPMEITPGPGRLAKQEANGDLARTASGGTVTKQRESTTTGWTDCGHDAWRPGIACDPFIGSGTTALVARRLGLHAVGIDASAEYLGIAEGRLLADRARRWIAPGPTIPVDDDQLSLLGGAA